MSVIPRFDGLYGLGYDAVVSRSAVLRGAGVALRAPGVGAIPALVREAFAAAPDRPLLDVPCGAMASLAHAGDVHRTAPVSGVDLSEPMLDRARRRVRRVQPGFDVELVHADALDLPFDDASFGTALSVNGLHCMPVPTAFVTEVARVLQPQGQFLFTTLVDAGTTRSRGINEAFRRGGVLPASPPTLEQVRAMLDDAGFVDVTVGGGRGLVAVRCRRVSD